MVPSSPSLYAQSQPAGDAPEEKLARLVFGTRDGHQASPRRARVKVHCLNNQHKTRERTYFKALTVRYLRPIDEELVRSGVGKADWGLALGDGPGRRHVGRHGSQEVPQAVELLALDVLRGLHALHRASRERGENARRGEQEGAEQ